MRVRWFAPFACVLLAAVMALGACAPPSAAPAPPTTPGAAPVSSTPAAPISRPVEPTEWDKVVAAAKKEGTVTIYSTFANPPWRQAIGSLLEQKYGIKAKWVFGDGAANAERIRIEHQTGQIVADVYHAGPIPFMPLKQQGYLVAFDPPEVQRSPKEAWHIVPTAYEKDKVVNVMGLSTGTTAWVNTKLVKATDYPKSFKDLLDPKWRGKMNMQDPTFGGGGSRMFHFLKDKYGIEYWQKMAEQKITFIRTYSDLSARLAGGEDALAIYLHPSFVGPYLEAKAPIEPLLMEEGMPVPTISLSITANAPHMNAAKVFVNLVFSDEGQSTVSLTGMSPVRKSIKSEWSHPLIARMMAHDPKVVADLESDTRHNKDIADKVAAKIFRLGEFAR